MCHATFIAEKTWPAGEPKPVLITASQREAIVLGAAPADDARRAWRQHVYADNGLIQMVIATNRKLARLPHLRRFLGQHPRAVVGWGRKASGRRAQWLARLLGRESLLLEDGFVRSLGRHDPPLSLIIDDLGVYYDATTPSRLETRIAQGVDAGEAARARALIAAWRAGGLSKYNHAPDYPGALPADYALVIDQTRGDCAVRYGMADPASFRAMLDAALAENPARAVLVKAHPDSVSHGKASCFTPEQLADPRLTVIRTACHAAGLLRAARAVYTVTSLMGFEALVWGKPVRCFGMPFYAGWGLSDDLLPAPARRGKASLEAVVHAALVAMPRYVDPATGTAWQAEQAIAYLAQGRRALWGAGA